MSTGVTVVIVPPATANGALHVGHLSGPYLAADIAARAARARGERVVTTAGFDVHQNWVLTRAENEGVDVDKLAATYRDEIVDALDAARIRYDVFSTRRARRTGGASPPSPPTSPRPGGFRCAG
jgi:methionyl-tRNA synthetase